MYIRAVGAMIANIALYASPEADRSMKMRAPDMPANPVPEL